MVTIILSCSARFLTSRDYQHWAESTWQAAEEPNHHAGESVDVRDATEYRFSLIWFLVREWFYRHMVFGSPHVLFFEAFPPHGASYLVQGHQHAMQLRSPVLCHFGWSSAADRLGTDTLPKPTLPFVCCVYISKWYNIYSHIRYSHCFASCLERSYQNPETNGCFWGLLKVDNLSISSLHSNFSQPSAMGTGTHLGLHQRSLRLELHTNWQSYRSQSASLEKYFQVSSISTSTVCQLNFIRFAEHAVQPTLHAVPTNHFSSDVCTVST